MLHSDCSLIFPKGDAVTIPLQQPLYYSPSPTTMKTLFKPTDSTCSWKNYMKSNFLLGKWPMWRHKKVTKLNLILVVFWFCHLWQLVWDVIWLDRKKVEWSYQGTGTHHRVWPLAEKIEWLSDNMATVDGGPHLVISSSQITLCVVVLNVEDYDWHERVHCGRARGSEYTGSREATLKCNRRCGAPCRTGQEFVICDSSRTLHEGHSGIFLTSTNLCQQTEHPV